MSGGPSWKLEGDYFEGCDCDSVCPCVFLGPPTTGSCHVTIAWHIAKGHYGDAKLDGLNVVAMFNSPGHMLQGPKWHAALYLDANAKPDQADALGKIFSGQAGGFFGGVAALIGDVKGVRSVPIEFEAKGKSRHVRIPKTLELEIEASQGGNKDENITLHNLPFGVTPGIDVVVSRSKKLSYHDHGYALELSGKNGFYSRFAYAP
jgi:hypothetical protein